VLTPVVDGARVRFPVVLTGTGAAVDLAFSPAELRFENVTVGRTSTPSTVTISNPSAAAIVVDALTITGSSGAFAQTNDCPASLPAGGTCTAAVTCTPGASQWYVGALVPNGPFIASQGVPLVCSGAPPITPSVAMSPPSATVRAGDEAVFSVALTRAEWLAQPLAVTCRTDAPATTCTVEPPNLPAGVGPASASVVVRTAGGGSFASAPASGGAGAPVFGLALLAIGAAPLAGKRARALVVLAALAGSSCLRTTERARTTPGTYAIVVTLASEVDATAQAVQSTLVVVSG
jgi:hypothetical protein